MNKKIVSILFLPIILCTACGKAEPITLGGTFKSDNFQITISDSVQVVSGSDGENISNLVRIPVTVTNNSTNTASLNEEKIIFFGNDSSQDKSIMNDYAKNDPILSNIKAGGTVNGAFYMLYTNDGTYSMEIDGQEISVDISVPTPIENKDYLNCITRTDLQNTISQLVDDIGCKNVLCSTDNGNLILSLEPTITIIENDGGYFRCKNAIVSCQTLMSASRAESTYTKFTCVLKNSILSDGSIGDITFEYQF